MDRLSAKQIEENTDSRSRWDLFLDHRTRVTGLLRSASGGPSSRLCVLGAGNCNDLDLPALLEVYREIHLVDLDADAVTLGVARQGLHGRAEVHIHGGIDLTGALDTIAAWSPLAAVEDADLAACLEAPVRLAAPALPGPFDVVASTCLLSQLLASVVGALGERHLRFLEALQAVRTGHLRLLVHLLAPGGAGVLISDIVSSDSFPPLASVPEDVLPQVIGRLIERHNFFHGLNPAVLATFFRADPVAAPQVIDLELLRPWRWDFGPRMYAVCALKFRKRSAPAP